MNKNTNRSKKTILQINLKSQTGSTGKLVTSIHNYLLKNNFNSFVAYSVIEKKTSYSFMIESKMEHYLRRGLNKIFGKKDLHSIPGTLRLIKNIRQIKPDLIHLHNIHQNSVNFPLLMKTLKSYNVPILYTLHDCWAFTGGCFHFTQLGCDKFTKGCIDCKQKRYSINKTAKLIYEEKKKALEGIENLKIICVSNWLKNMARKTFMKNFNLQVIYNGIDLSIFKPTLTDKRKQLGIAKNDFLILGVANIWTNEKGLNFFFELAEILEKPYKIVLVGFEKTKYNDNIIVINRTTDMQELAEIYNCADVLINPSMEESFGLTSVEAMACGIPVIAFNSTACGEIVDNNTGILLENFELDDLRKAIKIIKEEGKEHYTKRCVDRALHYFSKDIMIKEYMKVYESLMRQTSKIFINT